MNDAESARQDPPGDDMAEIMQRPLGGRLKAYTARSGPGWLQGAITLGGGSLAGALYLGTISGYGMMWLQPLAMVLGVIMLSAIAYVTLSTGERPFKAINTHVSPVLGWAWIIATLMANIVWCMPQFNLGRAAIQQNLLPVIGDGTLSTVVVCGVLLAIALVINFFYESGGRGIKIFEIVLKVMVGIVVLSFFGVAVSLTANGSLDWGAIFSGFLPNPSLLVEPSGTFSAAIAATGEAAEWWKTKIASDQRDIIFSAFGTAVGINMTFLLPYSMLRKRWGRNHRGLAIFDLSIGLIVPFVLATSCVVIAAASQFHAANTDLKLDDGSLDPKFIGKTVEAREAALPDIAVTDADRELAAMLVKRDNFALAKTLAPLTGDTIAQKVFGIGVLGMALSTIIILMLINGFTLCEMFGQPGNRLLHLAGCLISGVGGFFGPFLWSGASKAALAVPTSVIGGAMIPIAYFTFLLLMNSRSLLGDAKPQGSKAVIWNVLMGIATTIATAGSIWALSNKGTPGKMGIAVLCVLFVLGILGFLSKARRTSTEV